MIELLGWVCPITYLENNFRRFGGESGYRGTLIEQYLEPILYPLGLTRHFHIILGLSAIFINLLIYLHLWRLSRSCLL